ncbi:MAG: hypothetical protein WC455_13380 [Dehalococcoidia bacterium]
MITTIIAVGSIVINLVILGLCLKLYTEYFKDKSANNRGGRP